MLTYLQIRDFATVERLELETTAGMTVLTGETGAGKSIVLDALGLALGDRADSAVIRHGKERADLTFGFDIAHCADAKAYLAERELDDGDECVLRRTVGRDGRSKAYINGQPATLQNLRELGEMLVDIHGQHSHQSLLRRDVQRQTLDDYARHAPLLARVGEAYARWDGKRQELARLRGAQGDRTARLDLLAYQVRELDALALGPNELPELEEEHRRQANASRLIAGCQDAYQLAYEGEEVSALALLGRASTALEPLTAFDARLRGPAELIGNAMMLIEEAAGELRRHLDHLDLDPERLEAVEQRLAAIQSQARKHRVRPEELPALHERLATELGELQHLDVRLDGLEQEITAAAADYQRLAGQLRASRESAAARLGDLVGAKMQLLGMKGGRFAITLHPLAGDDFGPSGSERVEFMVSANAGQPLQPFNKVASGGELSRIGLALAVITAETGRIPTLVFDEVDVGIGGGTAEIVGRLLHELGRRHQVLCVTHQPQVAALGDHHLQVSKDSDGRETRTRVGQLHADARVREVARMLGGVEITAQTLSHAQEMLERAQHG